LADGTGRQIVNGSVAVDTRAPGSTWGRERRYQQQGSDRRCLGLTESGGQHELEIRGVADVNSDGKPDLIWQNITNGGLSVWFMNGIVMVSGMSFSPGMVADFNWKFVGPK
jgi:hypothetical protein